MMDDVTSPLKFALSTERLLDRAAELRAMALTVTSRQAELLTRRADQFVRRAVERQTHAAPTIQAANSWFQHYRRTGDQDALRCAIACRDMAVERKRAARSMPLSSMHKAREAAVLATGLAAAVKVVAESVSIVQSRINGARIARKVSPGGLSVLSGVVSIGVMILPLVSPFSDSAVIIREMPSFSAVAQTPMTQVDVANARSEQGEADQTASIRPQAGDSRESAGDDANHPTAAVDPRVPGTKRSSGHRGARVPLVRRYAANHGTWLWRATANAGGNS
jgi:hypothetical protein